MAKKQQRVTAYQYPVRLPNDLHTALQELAEREDRPVSRIIRTALRDYLQSQGVRMART